jgi:hypothetical protein
VIGKCAFVTIITFENTVLHSTYIRFKITFRSIEQAITRPYLYSERLFVKIRSDNDLFNGPKIFTLKLMYVLCETVFYNIMFG